MGLVVPIIQVALTAYSAVTALKALQEGNIMGAVMGGFGAYMGLANMGAFGAATGGDVLASSAAADTGGGFAAGLEAVEGATGDLFTGMAESSFTTPALEAATGVMSGAVPMAGASVANTLGATVGDIGAISADIGGGGFMESISSGWDSIVSAGEGFIDNVGNLISTKDGSLLASAGEAVGGTGNLMKMGGMAMDYYGKDKALKAKEAAAEQGYQRTVDEAKRKRASVGAAPGYVYQFGGRKETA